MTLDWKGGWSGPSTSLITYYTNDLVSYNNIIYIVKSNVISVPIGSSSPDLDMSNWEVFVSGGVAGSSGSSGTSGSGGGGTSSGGTIGPAEDGDYTDGIFTDFTSSTPIGTAIDRFNEVLLLLAPTPPSDWNNSITSIGFSSTSYTSRSLTSGSTVTIYTDTTPDLTNSDNVSTQANAKVDTSGLTFSLVDQGLTIETVTLAGTATPLKSSGNIRHSTSGDPYTGVSGKSGFWTGITDFSLAGSLPTITPSSNQRTIQLFHPGNDSPETFTYYIDTPLTPSITSLTCSIPSMTGYVSGVPTLASGQSITNVSFSIPNVSSYFYSSSPVWLVTQNLVNSSSGDVDSIPTSYGQTGSVTEKTLTIRSGVFSDLSFSFVVTPRNSISSSGTTGTLTSNSHRVDTTSSETSRKTSGSGSYPASGYNGVYDSTESLVGNYTTELQLRNGIYVYPSINYTSVDGPDYSSATGTRWATFNLGTFTNNSSFTLTINGSSGITSIGQANLLIEVKIEGATYWVDGDAAYSGVGNPGSTTDGVAAVISASSTATSRRITFGAVTYSGSIIVRIGFTSTGLQFTSLSAGSIV
jgi:hypothetical protein